VTGESSALDVVTVAQASVALGVHPTQVRLLVRRGDLAGERLGSQWVIPRSELTRFATRPNLAGRLFSQRSDALDAHERGAGPRAQLCQPATP
jgi:excisionase family DNA binding protein